MKLLIFALLLLFSSVANAQEATAIKGTLKGSVYTLTDSTKQNPFEGWAKENLVSANVVLKNLADSSIIIGSSTNLAGHYSIGNVKPGDYVLRATYVGFKTNEQQISISAGDTLIKNIQLSITQNLHDHSVAKTNFLRINDQGVVVYQPEDDYLVEVSQKWGAERSELGDLRTKAMSNDDIELRFWDGYGLFGTRGILLKKKVGNWLASKLTVSSCNVFYPDSLKGKISKEEFFSDLTTDDCNEENYEYGSLRSVDTVFVEKIKRNERSLSNLWNQLLEAGLLDLPTHVEHNWLMSDGRGFVVEIRIGNLYRASDITYLKEPEVDAHKIIKKLAKMLYQQLDPHE